MRENADLFKKSQCSFARGKYFVNKWWFQTISDEAKPAQDLTGLDFQNWICLVVWFFSIGHFWRNLLPEIMGLGIQAMIRQLAFRFSRKSSIYIEPAWKADLYKYQLKRENRNNLEKIKIWISWAVIATRETINTQNKELNTLKTMISKVLISLHNE